MSRCHPSVLSLLLLAVSITQQGVPIFTTCNAFSPKPFLQKNIVHSHSHSHHVLPQFVPQFVPHKKSSQIKKTTTTKLHLSNNKAKQKEEQTGKNNKEEDNESLVEVILNKYENEINNFCKGTNNFWKQTVIPPVQNYVTIQKAGTASNDIISKLIAKPELPGLPRPVWLTMIGSIPTGLVWYGYYKFSVEEELYQYELETDGKVSGFGGYGTLFPFVYGFIIGLPLSLLPGVGAPAGPFIVQCAGAWILFSQFNLYRRVNELCEEKKDEMSLDGPPLHSWWALLPPPLDVVVGLRQVHFLSEYWRIVRDEPYDKDIITEELFPFIACKERFTLKKFFRTPSMWFWFTKDMQDFDFEFLKD
mmetsp:Transcript_350/g.367  ORF Transcript_350/g.367 Transcript_350/m.367 type:complete len:361 (+) Transcript_350:121-1203(+)